MRQRVYTLYLVSDTQGLPPGGLCPNREWVDYDKSQPTAVKQSHTHPPLQGGCEVRLCHLLVVQPGNITRVVMARSRAAI